MFRDNEITYLIWSVILMFIVMVTATGYEAFYRDTDSTLETIAAIVQWVSSAIAVTIATLATRR